MRFVSELEVEVGGTERRAATGGLEYSDTVRLRDSACTGRPRLQETPQGQTWRVPIAFGDVSAELLYRFNRYGPAVSFGLDFVGEQPVVVRNVVLRLGVDLGGGEWVVNAAGNGLGSSTPLAAITSPVGVSPIGGLRGSNALVHLQSGERRPAVAIWFDNDVEIPEIALQARSSDSFTSTLTTFFAADLTRTSSNELQLLSIDIIAPQWTQFPPLFEGWLRSRGLTSPAAPPDWAKAAMMYEAQIGFSVFAGAHRYQPYPEISDLTADLDRIASLGFTVIQLMPRQPYPSYNIHDYWDIDVSYGPRELLIALVEECHRRGLRIILDVLLHGVLDHESIGAAADGVRSGPLAELVASETKDSFGGDVNDWNDYLIAWSRHILDFEPYWREGSPTVSPLIEEHPEWFERDSAGQVIGVYTKAFDARSRSWQTYFTDAMCFLMKELDIDGFRFDAPTYNDFPNWADWSRGRAGSSALACVGLFERLRPVVKNIKSDSLLYTEPSGHALRRSMDLNYNYDEQWLVTALTDPALSNPWGVGTAKGLACWMRDRDAMLPAGSMTAHHIDSHDTFWWPSWGQKWRREQFTGAQFRLLTTIFGSLPGPFMMFTGGEAGIEDLLPLLAGLKQRPVWQDGCSSWWSHPETPESIFGLTRSLGVQSVSVVANFADSTTRVAIPENPTLEGVLFTIGKDPTFEDGAVVFGPYSGVAFTHSPFA